MYVTAFSARILYECRVTDRYQLTEHVLTVICAVHLGYRMTTRYMSICDMPTETTTLQTRHCVTSARMKEIPAAFDNWFKSNICVIFSRNMLQLTLPNLTVLVNVLLKYLLKNFTVRFFGSPGTLVTDNQKYDRTQKPLWVWTKSNFFTWKLNWLTLKRTYRSAIIGVTAEANASYCSNAQLAWSQITRPE